MGRNRNKRHKNKKQIRTADGRKSFFQFASRVGGEETELKANPTTLEGSAETREIPEYDSSEQVRKASLKSTIALRAKEIALTAVLIPVILWLCKWVIDVKADLRYLNRVLEETREKVERLEENGDYSIFVTKDNLDLKLELIERDIKSAIPDTKDIERRLDTIEEEINKFTGDDN